MRGGGGRVSTLNKSYRLVLEGGWGRRQGDLMQLSCLKAPVPWVAPVNVCGTQRWFDCRQCRDRVHRRGRGGAGNDTDFR